MSIKMMIQSEENPKKKTMNLYLDHDVTGQDVVFLKGIDRTGNTFTVLTISPEGMRRFGAIPKKTGWPLDHEGRIKDITPETLND